jgi:TonB-linked SusC/RagA family outer membrane protein
MYSKIKLMKYLKMWSTFCALLICLCSNLRAQNAGEVTIKSVVHNEKGTPVSGVLVSGNQGKTVTYTDQTGAFTITVPANSVVLINGKGFKMQSLRANAVPARIGLINDNTATEVYIPFDKVNRQDAPGAISILNPETYIDKQYNLSIESGMNGRVAGLLWSDNIWGMENAIVMIDGVRREFSDITLPEVEQISVLKGINAVALYGAQAAKGIIYITTKKGEAGDRKISLRVNSGIAVPRALPKFLNSADYMTLYNEARRNDGAQTDFFAPSLIESHRTGNTYRYPNLDYYSSEYLKKFQTSTDANAEFSGGSNNARFYSNIGWSTGNTLLKVGEGKNERDNRLNIRGNVDLKLNDRISSSVYVSAIFMQSRRARSNSNYWNNAATLLPNRFAPLIPVDLISRNSSAALDLVKGSRNLIDGQYLLGGLQSFQTNPIGDLYSAGYDDNIQRVFQITNTINADLSGVLKGLSFHTLFNIDYRNSYLQSISNTYAVYQPTWNATADSITGLTKFGEDTRPGTQNINNTAQRNNNSVAAWFGYDKTVGESHNISAKLLGYTSSMTVSNVYQPVTNSHLGLQLGYNYKHKYWADFSGAYSNSTRLPEGHRTAFSPTLSLGWLLSEENFLENSKAINHLKLSVSAGILNTDLDITRGGQDYFFGYENIYDRLATVNFNDGVQAGNQPSISRHGANPDLRFPKRRELNASLEGGLFNDLLTFQATVFKTDMIDMATQRFSLYPNSFSTFVPYTNFNANKRSGFDLMLNVNKKVGAVELSLGTNLTYAKSEAKRDELFVDAYQNRTGKPVDAIFGLVSNGFFVDQNDVNSSPRSLFSETRPGDIKYVDQNGDKLIDSRDEVQIGRWIAPFTYGVNLNIGYKAFNLFVLGTGNNGGNAMRNGSYFWVSGDAKYSEIVLNRWTPATAATATYPRLSAQQSANNFRNSDFWLFKTDRFNLQKVQLSYTLPDQVFGGKSFVNGLMVYVAGANLYTFSKNRDILDLSVGTTPQFRYYNAGIRAKF